MALIDPVQFVNRAHPANGQHSVGSSNSIRGSPSGSIAIFTFSAATVSRSDTVSPSCCSQNASDRSSVVDACLAHHAPNLLEGEYSVA